MLRIFCWHCVGIWINFLFHWYRAWHARIMQVKVYPPPTPSGKKSKERDEVRLAFWIEIWYKPYADKHKVCEKRTTSVKRNKNLHFIYNVCMYMACVCIYMFVYWCWIHRHNCILYMSINRTCLGTKNTQDTIIRLTHIFRYKNQQNSTNTQWNVAHYTHKCATRTYT